MSGMPLKTAVSDVYPNPDNATANAGLGAMWTVLNEMIEKPELDLASAATIDLGGQLSTKLRITGTTGITSFGTTYRGPIFGRFQSSLVLTHNATTLILPGGANITTSAGGTFVAIPKATVSGTHDGWIVVYASDYLPNTALAPSRVKGLLGAPNAATPLTKYDLSADDVVLRNSNGGTVTRYGTGTITNDTGLAGSTVNGRDQSAAFTASTWAYLYFIWNGTTLATLSSATAPASFTGSTLPTGYTHWAFATAIRLNGGTQIVPTWTRGAAVYNQLEPSVLTAGTQTVETAVDMSSYYPPCALGADLRLFLNNGAGTNTLTIRLATGVGYAQNFSAAASTRYCAPLNIPNVGQNLYYLVSNAALAVSITLGSFRIPNGDC